MKNSFYFISFLTFIFSLVGCSKDAENFENETKAVNMSDKVAIENATLENKIKYAEFHLLKIATFIAKDLKSTKIANDIFEKGNINGKNGSILAEDLINSMKQQSRSNISNAEITEIQKSLNAFDDLEGINWKPVLSTVMFEKKLNRRGFDDSEPIFVLSTDTERENQVVDGYQLSESNVMEKISTPVNEAIATNNVVFRVGLTPISDNPDSDGGSSGGGGYSGGGAPNDTNPIPTGGVVGSGTTATTGPYTYGLKIRTMTCKYKKESIFESNDVYIVGAKDNLIPTITHNDVPQFFPTATQGWNWNGQVGWNSQITDGARIRHFTSTECNNQTSFIINWIIDQGSNMSQGQVFYYVIFEADNWPAPQNECQYNFPNGTFKILKYRSYEGEYSKPMLFNNAFSGVNGTAFQSNGDYLWNHDWMNYNIRRE